MDRSEQAAGIGALADPTRSALYEYVSGHADAVTREAAADAIGVPPHVARFQLDRLVELGLLEVEFRRLTGRSGPGAGRPSKLYRRAEQTIAVSLPERRFDLAGHLLARAIEQAACGTPIDAAVREAARAEGDAYGAGIRAAAAPSGADRSGAEVSGPARTVGSASSTASADAELDRLRAALAPQGYEPRSGDEGLVLANCPFHDLAQTHRDLICGMNHAYVEGVAEGLGCRHVDPQLRPEAGRCCVVIRAEGAGTLEA
ncbi:MAG: helix-turn-helix domain-containing protein [Actinobacteria bacterium]|nr:helix-turn-helix domain-containing protein [Actinomycetota bacterium]